MPILDTDILVALLRGQPDASKKINELQENGSPLSTTAITAYELLKGARLSKQAEQNTEKVQDLLQNIVILELDFKACDQAATLYAETAKKDASPGEFDILIAAITATNHECLVSRDRHFQTLLPKSTERW